MDNFEEIRKYKMLLDQGVINQDEFIYLKQKLFGLKSADEKKQKIKQVETECEDECIINQIEDERFIVEESQYSIEDNHQGNFFQEETVNEHSVQEQFLENNNHLIDTQRYNEQKRFDATSKNKKDEEKTKNSKGKTTVISWFFTVFFFLGALVNLTDGIHISQGIISLLLAAILLPPLSNTIKKRWKSYSKVKIVLVIILIVFFAYV